MIPVFLSFPTVNESEVQKWNEKLKTTKLLRLNLDQETWPWRSKPQEAWAGRVGVVQHGREVQCQLAWHIRHSTATLMSTCVCLSIDALLPELFKVVHWVFKKQREREGGMESGSVGEGEREKRGERGRERKKSNWIFLPILPSKERLAKCAYILR